MFQQNLPGINYQCRLLIYSISLLLLILPEPAAACEPYMCPQEPKRLALVIGNENYNSLERIPSARADALKMRDRLVELGFNVSYYPDVATVREFEEVVWEEFRKKINRGDFVVFYFSGHGFSLGSDNLIVPTGMPLSVSKSKIHEHTISVDAFESLIAESQPGLIIFFIDACRAIGEFKVDDEQGNNLVRNGPGELPSRNNGDGSTDRNQLSEENDNISEDSIDSDEQVNSIIVYPVKPGHSSNGVNDPEKMSVFTQVLYDTLNAEGQSFHSVFRRIQGTLNVTTNGQQVPINYGFSATDPYFKPTAKVFEEEKEMWSSALEKRDYTGIRIFLKLNSVGSYSAACRKWLADFKASRYTRISPIAVDRAWQLSSEDSVSIRASSIQLAFPRSLEVAEVQRLEEVSDAQVGLTKSKTSEQLYSRALFSAENIENHGIAVAVKNLNGLAEPNISAAVVARINSGTRLRINDTVRGADNNTYLSASTLEGGLFFIKIEPVTAPEFVSLGQPVKEIIVPSRSESLPGLIDSDPIKEALAELKTDNWNITWVSISTALAAPTDDPNEQNIRTLEIANAEYHLKKMGIEAVRITSISGNKDFSGRGVRIRFFGTK